MSLTRAPSLPVRSLVTTISLSRVRFPAFLRFLLSRVATRFWVIGLAVSKEKGGEERSSIFVVASRRGAADLFVLGMKTLYIQNAGLDLIHM